MKIHILILLLQVFVVGAAGAETNSCYEEGRNTEFCLKMKALRSQILMLELMRDKGTVDFGAIEALGHNMDTTINRLFVSASPNVHIQQLNEVKRVIADMRSYARENNIEAYRSMNEFRHQCISCHRDRGEAPVADIFPPQVAAVCHERGHNPMVCDNMYGLSHIMSFFTDAQNAQTLERRAAKSSTKFMRGIIATLKPFAPSIHVEGTAIFDSLDRLSSDLDKQLDGDDSQYFDTVGRIMATCSRCHQVK